MSQKSAHILQKAPFLLPFILSASLFTASAQNVGINTDGSSPNPNAILDIKASNKGILIPRTSTTTRLTIPNIRGLLIYDTTMDAFWYNTGIAWQQIGGGYSDGGWSNTYFGYNTGPLNKQQDTANAAFGSRAMQSLTDGSENTAMGADAMQSNKTGWWNTAIGTQSLLWDSSGANNVAIGNNSLLETTNGNGNTAVGSGALMTNMLGSNNTAIGYAANVSANNLTNATAIGYLASVNASNKVRIGNSAVTVIEGQVPFTTPSDGRYKYAVQEDVKGLDFILQLRPVTYQFDVERFDKASGNGQEIPGQVSPANYALQTAYKAAASIRRSGFIAQEVEKAAQTSGYDFSGIVRPTTDRQHYSLSYESFVVPLVKAVQEQQQQINTLEKRLADLEKKLDQLTQPASK